MTKEQAITILELPEKDKYSVEEIKAACKKGINDLESKLENNKKVINDAAAVLTGLTKMDFQKEKAAEILKLPIKNIYSIADIEHARQQRLNDPTTIQDHLKELINKAALTLSNTITERNTNREEAISILHFPVKHEYSKQEIENAQQKKINELLSEELEFKKIHEAAQFLIDAFSYSLPTTTITLIKGFFRFIKEYILKAKKIVIDEILDVVSKFNKARFIDKLFLIWLLCLTILFIFSIVVDNAFRR